MIYLAFLDDGHGLNTPGKRTPLIPELGRSIKENEFNRAVVDILMNELKRAGVHVHLTAPTDEDISLKERADYANKIYWQYCAKYGKANVTAVFISIHYNALDGKFDSNDPEGFSVHIYPGHLNKEAGKLAKCIVNELKNGIKQVNRGVKENDFAVLRDTAMPAVLSENGFMDNKREALLMLDKDFQREVAVEHAKGACNYFGIKYVEDVITVEPTKEQPSKWAEKVWNEATELGFVDGTRPHDGLTREEAAAMMVRLYNLIRK